jgi:hypothetical protein
MKDILKMLPQILGFIPSLMSNLKSIVILVLVLGVLGGIGYGVYFYATTMRKDPFKCVNGEIYKLIDFNSNVYEFKGGYCVENAK